MIPIPGTPNSARSCASSITNLSGAVVMTNWSFLSSANPRTLHLKQRLIENGSLCSVTQASRRDHRVPFRLASARPFEPGRTVRLVNAKDWCVPSRQGWRSATSIPSLRRRATAHRAAAALDASPGGKRGYET
ncbi:hypothetical protein [Bilophila wadsworthia]|uniref:hypothetical protein n=1 Tax=Bilophila wadsworthia TaxID=35833 RepID=UPI0039907F9C